MDSPQSAEREFGLPRRKSFWRLVEVKPSRCGLPAYCGRQCLGEHDIRHKQRQREVSLNFVQKKHSTHGPSITRGTTGSGL